MSLWCHIMLILRELYDSQQVTRQAAGSQSVVVLVRYRSVMRWVDRTWLMMSQRLQQLRTAVVDVRRQQLMTVSEEQPHALTISTFITPWRCVDYTRYYQSINQSINQPINKKIDRSINADCTIIVPQVASKSGALQFWCGNWRRKYEQQTLIQWVCDTTLTGIVQCDFR